jgi:hypothetical protein
VVALSPANTHDLDKLAQLARADGFDVDRDGASLLVAVDGHEPRSVAVALNTVAIEHDIVLAELHVRRPTLESHYLAVVEGAGR